MRVLLPLAGAAAFPELVVVGLQECSHCEQWRAAILRTLATEQRRRGLPPSQTFEVVKEVRARQMFDSRSKRSATVES